MPTQTTRRCSFRSTSWQRLAALRPCYTCVPPQPSTPCTQVVSSSQVRHSVVSDWTRTKGVASPGVTFNQFSGGRWRRDREKERDREREVERNGEGYRVAHKPSEGIERAAGDEDGVGHAPHYSPRPINRGCVLLCWAARPRLIGRRWSVTGEVCRAAACRAGPGPAGAFRSRARSAHTAHAPGGRGPAQLRA